VICNITSFLKQSFSLLKYWLNCYVTDQSNLYSLVKC